MFRRLTSSTNDAVRPKLDRVHFDFSMSGGRLFSFLLVVVDGGDELERNLQVLHRDSHLNLLCRSSTLRVFVMFHRHAAATMVITMNSVMDL